MKIEIPEIDIETASLEELEDHGRVVARAENDLRGYAISVQFKIIEHLHELRGPQEHYPPVRRMKLVKKADISQPIEDIYSLEDFK